MAETVAEQAGETVAAIVENATDAIASQVINAEARAAAAEDANATLTEAAMRDAISRRVNDVEEGISECQSELEETAADLQSLETIVTLQGNQIAELSGALTAMQILIGPHSPPPKPGPSGIPKPSMETPGATPGPEQSPPENKDSDDAGGPQDQLPKRKRHGLI